MNEVALHRGSSPHLNTIDAFVDGQHLTEAVVRTAQKSKKYKLIYDSIAAVVGRIDRFHANRFHSLFPLRGRSNRPPIAERSRSHADLPPKSFLSPARIPSVVLHYSSSTCCTWHCLSIHLVDDDSQIGDRSRAPAGVSMDGQASHILKPGESVTVRASLHPIPCINRSSISDPALDVQEEGAGPGKEDDWVRDINNLLQYNATFRSKALLRHSRT